MEAHNRIIALDVGEKRIGIASANVIAQIAMPLTTLVVDEHIFEHLVELLEQQTAIALVIGLPRDMRGEATAQTRAVQDFAQKLRQFAPLPVYWQDEAVTSVQAQAELQAGKTAYQKGDIDALAATYILEDFIRSGGINDL